MTTTPETAPEPLDAAADDFVQPAIDDAAQEQIARLEAEIAQLKDQALRALAEAENTRRRAERDREDAARYGVTALARDLLTVSDNLSRAIEAVDVEQAGEVARNLLAGVEATGRELQAALERHGIKRIDPLGEAFDPNFHQAMFEVPESDRPNGSVVQVLQVGFVIHDRLLRPALVGVAKNGERDRVDTSA